MSSDGYWEERILPKVSLKLRQISKMTQLRAKKRSEAAKTVNLQLLQPEII